MSPEVPSTAVPPEVAPRKSPAKAKAKRTKKAKKSKGPSAKGPDRTTADVPATERRVALVKLLRKMGAVSSSTARSIGEVAEKLGYTRFDVYGLVNGTGGTAGSAPRCLSAAGIIATAVPQAEGERGLSLYLTAKGKKADLSEPPFARSRTPKEPGAK